jgi:thiamine kinase-like enzyme
MALTLEEAIARVPAWKDVRDLKATPLGGGITNNNYRIDVGGESFVLRIAGANTELLGINRETEYAANLAAGRLGIAPEVYDFIRPEGYLVTRFITGRPIPPKEIRLPENIQRVAELVRRIHEMPAIPGQFDVFAIIAEYTRIARSCQVTMPQDFDRVSDQLHAAGEALQVQPLAACPCHNDLLNGNFLTADRIYILDWEYAGMGDPFFDLGNFSDHHQLTDEQDTWLLECYFGKGLKPSAWAHLKIMKILSDLHEASWGLVQIGISKLDFNFREYADRFYGRVRESMKNPHWSEWLKEVRENV